MKRYLYCAGILLLSALTSVQAADIQGLWKVNFSNGSNSDWVIGANNGFVYGSFFWIDGQAYSDKLEGTLNNDSVSITRFLTATLFAGKTQTFTGKVVNNKASGSWSGVGCSGSCTWSATITPLATSTPTCPVVTCPTVPTCPTTPSCPAVTTTSNATFNFNTGRLIILNLAVSMSAPFGGAEQIFNYGIEMQQRTGAFVFDLDLSKVVQR